mgnify:CR=1 FL=1
MKRLIRTGLAVAAALLVAGSAPAPNPIVPGWYADPEIHVFAGRYWIYPTYSDHFGTPDGVRRFSPAQEELRRQKMVRPSYGFQTFFNAFSSPDLVHWTKHSHVFDVKNACNSVLNAVQVAHAVEPIPALALTHRVDLPALAGAPLLRAEAHPVEHGHRNRSSGKKES